MKLLFSSLLLFFVIFSFSQPYQVQYLNCPDCNDTNHSSNMVFTYDENPTNYQTSHVASDYGVRDHGTDHYDWHGGVDYSSEAGNADFGDGIIAIRGGTITTIARNRYKYIFIDGIDSIDINGTMTAYDFGYGHLFRSAQSNQKSGNFYWQRILGNVNPVRYAIIIDDSTALYEDANSFVVHPSTGDTIQTTNQVTAGQVIGPIGNSITRGSVSAHLHLYLFENDQFGTQDNITKNPLQFVVHDEPTFDVGLFRPVTESDPNHSHQVNGQPVPHPNWPRFNTNAANSGIQLTYPGDQVSQIVIRAKMDSVSDGNSYANAVMNTEKVELMIHKDSSDVIKGPFFRAEFNIDGTLNNEDRYPEDLISRGQGRNNTTGIQPWAYSDRRQRPWDIFHFADFATRVHKDDLQGSGNGAHLFADLPDDARYRDGRYGVFAKVTSVVDSLFYSDTTSIIIDNFMPYIDKVTLTLSGGLPIYQREWYSFDPNATDIGNGYISTPIKLEVPSNETTGLIVRAIASEPLTNLSAFIPGLSTDTIIGDTIGLDSMTWQFLFISDTLDVDSCYTIEFYGEDLSGNELLNLTEMAGDETIDEAQIRIPMRQNTNMDATTWAPIGGYSNGVDDVHEFCLEGCINPDSLSINNSRLLTNCMTLVESEFAIINSTSGLSDGAIHVGLAGGTPPFSFQWKDENENIISNEQNLENIPAGTYCFEIQDATCCKISGCQTVKNCSEFISHFIDELACNGVNGSITVMPNGDLSSLPYTYEWDNGMNSQTIIGVPAGTYCVTVTDAGGCTATACHNLIGSFTLDAAITNSCAGEYTGSIELSVEGGTSTEYYYSWEIETEGEYEYEEVADSLNPGIYCVTVTDETECSIEACYEVLGGIDPDFAIQIDDITCVCPGGYGVIDISVNGDAGSYTFAWPGDNVVDPEVEDAEVTQPGIYQVIVTNSYGCTVQQDFTVPLCNFNFDNFHVDLTSSCYGPNTGSIQVSVNDAMGPYLFVLETIGGSPVEEIASTLGTILIEGLAPENYCLRVISGNGCEASACDLIIEEFPALDITYTVTPASSSSANDGAINLEVSGAIDPNDIYYLWTGGYTTQDISGLSPGQYSVGIYYDNLPPNENCTYTVHIEVGTCNSLNNVFVQGEVTPLSFSGNDGAIDLSILGAEGYEFDFQWTANNDPMFSANTEDINGLAPGRYYVEIRHPDCPGFVINEYFDICQFSFELRVFGAYSCDGFTLMALHDGVNSPFTYQWSNGTANQTVDADYDQEYCVTITDDTGCSAVRCITIILPEMELSFDVTNTTMGASQGSVTANVAGNLFPPLSYAWDNGMTGQTISNLPAGDYHVTVTDDCGRTITDYARVECEITSDDVLAIRTNATCGMSSTGGAIDLKVLISDLGYNTFEWSNGATTEDITGLAAGEYCVTITNHPSNCIYKDCYTIETDGNGDFAISFDKEPACNGSATGTITANVTGGVEDYSYVWTRWNFPGGLEEVGIGQILENVASGFYAVRVTDALGCTDANYVYFWPSAPVFDFEISLTEDVVCEGETVDASIINITGGEDPYAYEWRRLYEVIGNDETKTGLEPDWYFVEVNDANGCKREKAFQVAQHPDIVYKAEVKDACLGLSSGGIDIIHSGNYTFQWSNGQTGASIGFLSSGNYSLTITDEHGCTREDAFTVGTATLDIIQELVTDNPCGECTGSIDIEVEASNDINYKWSNGATTQDLTELCTGDYSVTITSEGCVYTNTYTVEGLEAFEYEVEILEYFDNDLSAYPGSAKVRIISNNFTGGNLILSTNANMNPEIATSFNSGSTNYVDVNIPLENSEAGTFYFSYTSYNTECTYTGSFENIPTCQDEIENFSFTVEHLSEGEGFCEAPATHSYEIHRSPLLTQNPPYYLRITMLEANDPAQSGFTLTVEEIAIFPFTVDGIPSGSVKFEFFSLCDDPILSREHTNCCQDISCEVLSEGYDDDPWGEPYDNYVYDLDFVELYIRDLCYDGNCSGIGNSNDCSEIIPTLEDQPSIRNCWFGTVTIDYPTGEDAVFEVLPDVETDGSNVYDEVNWINEESWRPDMPGTYSIRVIYDGDENLGSGADCEVEIEVDFYGTTNYKNEIVFRNWSEDFPWTDNLYNDVAENAYYGAAKCESCGGFEAYQFGWENCAYNHDYEIVYFNFQPIDYNNACNSGGVLTIMDFNENNIPEFKTVFIPPNSSLGEWGYQAFNRPVNHHCSISGWCHFDGNVIYGITGFDKPILATWFDEESCIDNSDPDNSAPPCTEENCPFGECVAGVCVEECYPPCPEGFYCLGGECINEDDGTPCIFPCDCPPWQTCFQNNCVDATQECTVVDGGGGCQCPDGYICNGGTCVPVPSCQNCIPGQEYCKNNECEDCPTLGATFCYYDCGVSTDCILEIELISSVYLPAAATEIIVKRNNIIIQEYSLSIGTISPRRIIEVIPCDGNDYHYIIEVEFEDCSIPPFSAPFQVDCTCFTGGEVESENFLDGPGGLIQANKLKIEETKQCVLYPNPFQNIINVEYIAESSGTLDITISDIYGKQIQSEFYEMVSGKNEMEIQLQSKLSTGVYFVLITNEEGEREVFKMLHSKF